MNSELTIGIDVSRANQEQKTGVGWYAFFVVEAFKRLHMGRHMGHSSDNIWHDVRVILYSDKPLEGALATLPKGWESRVLRWPPRRLWTQVRLSSEMLVRPPDVLFVPAHVFPIVHPKKTVMMVHDVAALRFVNAYSWFERWYTLWSAGQAIRKLWKVIVPSEYTKQEIGTLVGKNITNLDYVRVIPHGYDTQYRKIADTAEVERVLAAYHINQPFLLSVGRLEEKKNICRIIEAFEKIKRQTSLDTLRLVLIGSPGHGYRKILETIQKSPHASDIIELGWIPTEDIVAIMNAAKAFVFPSLSEGFGMPILEAFACGTPVITSRGTSTEEVAGNAAVYVNPYDEDDIAEGIARLFSDSDLRQSCVEKGFVRLQNFSWEKCARETWGVLCEE